MDFIHKWAGVVAIIIIAIGWMTPALQFGAEGDSNFTNVVASGDVTATDDLLATDDLIVTDDGTINGRTFTVTTSNAATSTFSGGCIQTTATSTATPIRFVIGNTGVATSTYTGINGVGFVAWQYGLCPI